MQNIKILPDNTIEVVPAVIKTANEALIDIETELLEWRKNHVHHTEMVSIANSKIAELEAQVALINAIPVVEELPL